MYFIPYNLPVNLVVVLFETTLITILVTRKCLSCTSWCLYVAYSCGFRWQTWFILCMYTNVRAVQ